MDSTKKKIYCWVIFVYRCEKGKVEILLISKNAVRFEPVYCEGKTCEQARKHLHNLLSLKNEDFFSDRDVNWWKSLSVSKSDKTIYKIAVSAARMKEGLMVETPKGYKSSDWFDKEKAFEKLRHWKGYTRSFKKVFTKDTFWECLPT